MIVGSVGGGGGVPAFECGSWVGGDALAFEENFHRGGCEFGVDGFPDKAVGDAVGVGIHFDVVIDRHFGPFPFGKFVGTSRQGEGGGAIHLLEELAAGGLNFPKRPVIDLIEELADGDVHIGEGIKETVTEDGKDPAFSDEDTIFHFRFIPGAPWPGGEDGGPVVLGHVLVGGVECGFVEAGFDYPAFEIIGNQETGNNPEIGEGPGVSLDPVGKSLGAGGLGVGEGGGSPNGDEKLGERFFAGLGVGDEKSVRVIDENLVACLMGLPHNEIPTGEPHIVKPAEGGVLIAVGVIGFVFDPKLVQCEIESFVILKFLMNHFPVWERFGGFRRGDGEQEIFQCLVSDLRLEGPNEASFLESSENETDGVSGNTETFGDGTFPDF